VPFHSCHSIGQAAIEYIGAQELYDTRLVKHNSGAGPEMGDENANATVLIVVNEQRKDVKGMAKKI